MTSRKTRLERKERARTHRRLMRDPLVFEKVLGTRKTFEEWCPAMSKMIPRDQGYLLPMVRKP